VIQLETLSGYILTLGCKNVTLPQFDILKAENRLLDGSLHIQTVGNPLKTINFEILITRNNAERLDHARAIGEELYFINENKKYRGIIRNVVDDWTQFGKRYRELSLRKYTGSIEFVVLEEVT